MLVLCWASVVDGGPTLNQHCVNDSCLLGSLVLHINIDWSRAPGLRPWTLICRAKPQGGNCLLYEYAVTAFSLSGAELSMWGSPNMLTAPFHIEYLISNHLCPLPEYTCSIRWYGHQIRGCHLMEFWKNRCISTYMQLRLLTRHTSISDPFEIKRFIYFM